MKKGVLISILWVLPICFFILCGCSGNQRHSGNLLSEDALNGDTVVVDSLEDILDDSPIAKAADELFDDFFFNFAANRKLQNNRIKFPLPVKENGQERQMKKSEWEMDYFFMKQGYYSLLFDDEKQMEIVSDTAVRHVVVEKIFLSDNLVKQYVFDHVDGIWMLTGIDTNDLSKNKNTSFWAFYKHFTTDNRFQKASLHVPVSIILPDPDDDFESMTADLYPEQWVEFKPQVLPNNIVYNIIYGQKYKNASQKLFVIRGIANGLETKMTFKNIKGKWILTKLTKL